MLPLVALLLLGAATAGPEKTEKKKKRRTAAEKRRVLKKGAKKLKKRAAAEKRKRPRRRKTAAEKKKEVKLVLAARAVRTARQARGVVQAAKRVLDDPNAHPGTKATAATAASVAAGKAGSAPVKATPEVKRKAVEKVVEKKSETMTPEQGAQALRVYTKNGGNQGSRGNTSPTVAKCQKAMGLKDDGIIGQITRRRAKDLGHVLYPRSYQK